MVRAGGGELEHEVPGEPLDVALDRLVQDLGLHLVEQGQVGRWVATRLAAVVLDGPDVGR
jgi:hypothetical protein